MSYYLEQHPGWGNFALPDSGENAAFAAQQEFLRRRQAFMVGAVKVHTDADLWTRLRQEHADLLQNVPTKGRHIDWDTLDEADMPLFGANKRHAEANGGESVDAQRRRMREHWANVRLEEELDRRREVVERRMEQCCVPVVNILMAAVVAGTAGMMQYFPPESPMVLRDDGGWGSSLSGHNSTPSPVPAPPATDSGSWSSPGSNGGSEDDLADGECNSWACQTVVWGPRAQFALGGLFWLFCLVIIFNKQGCKEMCRYFGAMLLLGGLGYWSLIMSPVDLVEVHWAVAYILCATCTGLVQPLFVTVPLATALDALQRLESANNCLLFVACSACQLCTWLIVYAIALVDVRSSYEIPEHDSGVVVPGGDSAPEPEPEAHAADFSCGFFCSVVPWFSRVQAGIGLLSLVLAAVGWLKHWRQEGEVERDEVLGAVLWIFLTIIGAGISLWPSTLSGEETCTTGWWVAYIFAPFCVVVLGPLWASCNILCCFHWLLENDDDEDHAFNIAAVIGCCCGIGYLVAIIVTRVSNSDWEPASLGLANLECGAWCEVLFSAPLVEIGIGCISMVVTALLKCHGRRPDDHSWEEFAVATFFAGLAWWPSLVFMVILPDSLVEMNGWLATITVPLWTGCNGTLWTLLAVTVLLEHVRDESMENIFGNFETFMSLIMSGCVVTTVGYIASVYHFRASADLYVDHTDMPPQPEVLYDFICTWPCRLVWGLVSFAVGFGLLSVVLFFRSLCVGPEDNGLCANLFCCRDRQQCSRRRVLATSFQVAAFVAIVGLSVYEGVFGYPLAVPVEGLVTGNAFWTYLLLPGMTLIGTVCSWRTAIRSSSPRVRMLSRLYKAPTVMGILSLVGSAWLLYVLRHSVDIKNEDERSDRSKLILLQAVGIPYVGVSMMLWCWGSWRGEARRQVCVLVARPFFLWVPASAWPVVLAAASDDRHVLDDISLVWPLGSLSIALMGFSSEIAWFWWKRRLTELNGGGIGVVQQETCRLIAICISVLAIGPLWAVFNVVLLAA